MTGVLVSHWDFRDADLTFRAGVPVFADSGAFSAWRSGTDSDASDYALWLDRWHGQFVAYANLDVIGDPDATWENQRRLETVGFKPLPVFHTGASFDWLARYLDLGYEYIALGGMVPYLANGRIRPLARWLVRCFRMADGRARFHGFGATNWQLIKDFPFRSTDSTTWMAGTRYGAQLLFADDKLFQTRAHLLGNYLDDLHRLGFSVRDAVAATRLGGGPGRTQTTRAIALASLQEAERVIRRRHSADDFCIYLAADRSLLEAT